MNTILNNNHLAAILAEAKDEMRELAAAARQDERIARGSQCPVTGKTLLRETMRFVDANGLGKLVEAGAKIFEEETKHHLPHNLIWSQMSEALGGPAPFRYRGRWLSPEGADNLLKEYGRVGGWLKTAATLSAARKALMKGMSSSGVNSPYTHFDIWHLVRKYPSPHRFNRALIKARERADGILAAWPGDRRYSSWAQLAVGLIATRKPGKAAIYAAARALGYDGRGYSKARDWLASMRTANFPVADYSDGVIGQREVEPIWQKLGISVYRLRVAYGNRFKIMHLVCTEAGRTFHAESWGDAKYSVQQALEAWRRQDEIAEKESDLVGFLRGDMGFCPMVVREHSYRAGNCQAGTESWARQMGLSSRSWIPGEVLVAHLGDERVRRVAYACREAFEQQGLLTK